jgi:hypothetical protein
MFDPVFQTPHKTLHPKEVPHKMAKSFSKKRQAIYKSSYMMRSYGYHYAHPLVKERNMNFISQRLLPKWADALSIIHRGVHSGALASGCPPEDMIKAVIKHPLSKDPFRSYMSGGYDHVTDSAAFGASTEMLHYADLLQQFDIRDLLYVYRKDVKQPPALFGLKEENVMKRKNPFSSESIPKRKVPEWGDDARIHERYYERMEEVQSALRPMLVDNVCIDDTLKALFEARKEKELPNFVDEEEDNSLACDEVEEVMEEIYGVDFSDSDLVDPELFD